MKVLGVEVPPAEAEKEPVVDVPAIDMTERSETAAADDSRPEVAKPARRRRAAKPKARQAKAAKAAGPTLRDGSVGRTTFAAVEALVKEGSSKTDAFKAVAKDTNRSAGTVAATYYRVARSKGTVKPRRGRETETATAPSAPKRRSAGRRGARSDAGTTQNPGRISAQHAPQHRDIDRLATSLVESVNALADVVKAQTDEVADLRRRLDGLRSILD
jgi:hypothetical protein